MRAVPRGITGYLSGQLLQHPLNILPQSRIRAAAMGTLWIVSRVPGWVRWEEAALGGPSSRT